MAKFLIILTLLFAIAKNAAAGEGGSCYATLDWTVAETLTALGKPPCAVGDVQSYKKWVSEPPLPQDVVDLGVRNQPNLEQIATLSYTLQADYFVFINTSFYQSVQPILAQFPNVDKVYSVDFYKEGNAWQNILHATEQIAQMVHQPESAARLIEKFSQKMTALLPQAKPFTDRPIALVQFIDSRHLRIYGINSPFGEVLRQLGFQNAWREAVNSWGFSTINITQLAKLPANSRFVVVKPYPADIPTALTHNTLWAHLPMSQNALVLPEIWTFGGIPSAERFADALLFALQHGGEPW